MIAQCPDVTVQSHAAWQSVRYDGRMTEHKSLVEALIAAQKDMGPAVRDAANPHFKNDYVTLESAWNACRDALHAHGLTVIQYVGIPCIGGATMPVLITELAHVGGETRRGEWPLLPSKPNDPQALASCSTYARRYSLMAMVGLVPTDDDGNAASGHGRSSAPTPPPPPTPAPEPPKPALAGMVQQELAAKGHDMITSEQTEGMKALRQKLGLKGDGWTAYLTEKAGRAVDSAMKLRREEAAKILEGGR